MADPVIELGSPIELETLEPSPIEETPKDSSGNNYFLSPAKPSSKSTSFLGLGGHSVTFYLTGVQRYSTYVFSIFGLAHIANTALIPLITQSVTTADSYLLLTRPLYQSRPQEMLLVVAPAVLHVAAGVALRIVRASQAARRYGATHQAERQGVWARIVAVAERMPVVSGTAHLGHVLVPLVLTHALVVRGLPLWFEGSSANSGLGFVAHGFARLPLIHFVGYSALIGVASMHFVWGGAKWLGLRPAYVKSRNGNTQLAKKRRWYQINGVAILLALIWGRGGIGVVGRGGAATGWLAAVYDGLYKKIPGVVGWI